MPASSAVALAAYSHSIHPHLAEAVQVPFQSKTGAGALDRLTFCTCHGILVVTSFFPAAAVRTDAGNRHDGRHEHPAALDCFVFLYADDSETVWTVRSRVQSLGVISSLKRSV